MVVMLPFEDYKELESIKKNRKMRLNQVAERMSKWRSIYKEKFKDIDSTAFIREMRQSRW
jgi:hypothetical protein